MAITWGSTVGAETAAQRHNRDVAQRGGDKKVASYDGNNQPVWTTVGANATGGRNDREFLKRGADKVYTYVDGAPVAVSVANGRSARQYVNAATGVSAITTTSYATLLAAAIAAANA